MLGGPIIGAATLSRFFALHVFIVPGLLIAFIAVHVLLVLKLGINEWPMPGRIVRRETYLREYHDLTHRDGVPFAPYAIWKDIVFSGVVLLAIGVCAYVFGPFGPAGEPDPTIIQTAPQPGLLLPVVVHGPGVPAAGRRDAVPVDRAAADHPRRCCSCRSWPVRAKRAGRRRPVAVMTILLVAVSLGTMTHLGTYTPWSPQMDAWSGAPVPQRVPGRTHGART